MMQGDQYAIPVEILMEDGRSVTADDIIDVEIVIGSLRKSMSAGEIRYSPDQKAFLFPLTQEETFSLTGGPRRMQVRVKLTSGEVIGVRMHDIDVAVSMSQEVL